MSDQKNFLKEYKELCIKYNIIIHACGCCGGPSLERPDKWFPMNANFDHFDNRLGLDEDNE